MPFGGAVVSVRGIVPDCCGLHLAQREHVRIDVVTSRLSKSAQVGSTSSALFFLTPMCGGAVVQRSLLPRAYASGEMSQRRGLIRWPVYLVMPLGFGLLLLQGWSELIKRIAFLQGLIEDPTVKKQEKTAEEELAESIRRLTEAAQQQELSGDTPWNSLLQPRPDHVRGADRLPAAGLSRGLQPGACGLFFAFIGIELGVLPEAVMQAAAAHLRHHANDTLLAIPFFTLMGLILERSGMAEDLLDTIGQVFGPIRGGLALAVIFVGALLAATTGVVAASVISMGLISLPIMLRYGYDRRLASGVIAASGTLAQIIPPPGADLLADQLGRAWATCTRAPSFPASCCGLVCAVCHPDRHLQAPVGACPPEAHAPRRQRQHRPAFAAGAHDTDHCGIRLLGKNMAACTPGGSEAVEKVALDETIVVAMCFGVALAFIAASVNRITRGPAVAHGRARDLRADSAAAADLPGAGHHLPGHGHADRRRRDGCHGRHHCVPAPPPDWTCSSRLATTTKLSCFVMFILIGATMFGLTFQGVDGPKWVEHLLTGLPGGQVGFLIVVNIMIFFLAFFLDFFELSVHRGAAAGPVAEKWAST
jgi:TRAP-type C4-dicarboxylate transport system permease small subunit